MSMMLCSNNTKDKKSHLNIRFEISWLASFIEPAASPLIDLIHFHMFRLIIIIKVGDVLLPGTPNLASTGQRAFQHMVFTNERGS